MATSRCHSQGVPYPTFHREVPYLTFPREGYSTMWPIPWCILCYTPPGPREQTDTCENIIFSQRYLPAVEMSSETENIILTYYGRSFIAVHIKWYPFIHSCKSDWPLIILNRYKVMIMASTSCYLSYTDTFLGTIHYIINKKICHFTQVNLS